MPKSFKKFVEEKEDGTLVSSLQDMFGINPEDLRNEPQLATFFSIASRGTNLGSYKIVGFKRSQDGRITHAVVKSMSMDKVYKDDDGSPKRMPKGAESTEELLVPISDLDKLMSQDFSANQPQGL